MDRVDATRIVNAALDRLLAEQPELLALDVAERALAHQLAIYLTALIPDGLDVDIEYNRHGPDPKTLHLPPRTGLNRKRRAVKVYPDILVHKRNSDQHNSVVLELKKPGERIQYDDLKLRAFRKELNYMHAGHVILGRDQSGMPVRELIWVDG